MTQSMSDFWLQIIQLSRIRDILTYLSVVKISVTGFMKCANKRAWKHQEKNTISIVQESNQLQWPQLCTIIK